MSELIICEKPSAALKIAEALADKTPKKETYKKKVPFYRLTHNKKEIIVAPAVGHLYSVDEKEKKGWVYPVFEMHWIESSKLNKAQSYSRDYLLNIKKLAKEADEITVACDYDIEGEVIGLNIVRFATKRKDANRMKFSTLTKPDLVRAYEHKSSHLDWGQANAGETRHFLDWMYGINLSRALTASIKATGAFKLLSIGRVQGPALKMIVEKEKEILAFKSKPFWQIELKGNVKDGELDAWHIEDKFWEKEKADNIIKKTKGKSTSINDVKKKSSNQSPPTPFDLTTLQIEAHRCLRLSPKRTLSLAQELYTSSFISYPRTSSQKLPKEIGYKEIIADLSKQKTYSLLCNKLLEKKLTPNEGKKTDPAHPSIYPTGIIPKEIDSDVKKLYDLIVKRFLATFAQIAKRESTTAKIECNGEIFVAKGTITTDPGWHEFYQPYVKQNEIQLPSIKQGETVNVKKIELHAKETQPPKRYTPASIIKELEKRNLGTKSTRADILDKLFQRNYIDGKSIETTSLGMAMIDTLEKYSPKIIDDDLTAYFEVEMDNIRHKKKNKDMVIEEAKKVLTKILNQFKKKEKDIGKGLIKATREMQTKENMIGDCMNCKKEKLMIRRGKFGKFIACDGYPDCKTTFALPSNALIKTSKTICKECQYPSVIVIKKRKRPQELCINPECPSKTNGAEEEKEEKEERICPKCKSKLILRKSFYGQFYGCSTYPKCRHISKI
ncbi:DNA topoisomerase I [Candidatus Woesearchaeota archaeon]|jgi:DNA topoisomerase-1|nr:DNA topoisomerase I [Candidatus Woesearchaeota archaeon]